MSMPNAPFPQDGDNPWGGSLRLWASQVVAALTSSGQFFEVAEDPENKGMAIIVASGSVTPNPPTGGSAPTILTTELGPLTVGVPVDGTIQTLGDPAPSFFVSAGGSPAGLKLSAAGRITGTPSAPGPYDFTLTSTNPIEADTQRYTGTITGANSAPSIVAQQIVLTQGVPASAQLTATGSDPKTWSVLAGGNPRLAWPSTPAPESSGTPTGSGTYSVNVKVENAYGSDTETFSGTITTSSGPVNPNPGGNVGRIKSYGPNGSHWPSRTPRPEDTTGWDDDIEALCTWKSIGDTIQAINARNPNGKCRIQVVGGTLTGNGAGSTSTPVLQNVGLAGRASRILIVPKDGPFSIKHSASARLHNIVGVTFAGFSPWGLGVAEASAYGFVFTNCKDVAWAWSKTRFANITSTAGSTDGVELVECVSPQQGSNDADRMAFRNGDGGNTYNVFVDGCYSAGNYKAAGSSAHCDTIQISGAGVFQNIDFRDTAVFGSTNAVYITTTETTGKLTHVLFIGGFRTALRYPVGEDRSQFTIGPVTFNGAPKDYKAYDDCILVGKVVPKFTFVSDGKVTVDNVPVPVSGAWVVDNTLMDTAAKIDAATPLPTDTFLQNAWAAI